MVWQPERETHIHSNEQVLGIRQNGLTYSLGDLEHENSAVLGFPSPGNGQNVTAHEARPTAPAQLPADRTGQLLGHCARWLEMFSLWNTFQRLFLSHVQMRRPQTQSVTDLS